MSRVKITETIWEVIPRGGDVLYGVARTSGGSGINVEILDADGDPVTIYAAPTGSTTLANPLTSDPDTGELDGYLATGGTYTFEISGTGITPITRTVVINSPANGVYDITHFGAIADDAGAIDSTDAIQAAIDACAAADGGDVYVPPGRFMYSSQLTAPADTPISIRGAGRGTSTLYCSAALGADVCSIDFGTVSTPGVQQGIYDLTLEGPGNDYGNSKGVTSNGMAAIRFGAKFRAERCRFWKWKYGVYIYGDHQTVQSCDWRSCYYNIYFPATQPTYGDQHFIDNTCVGATFASIGVAQADCYFQVHRSHFGFSPFGVYLETGGDLRGCTFTYAHFEGIGNAAFGGASGTQIRASYFNITVKGAGSTYLNTYTRDGYIDVPILNGCEFRIDGTTTSGVALGGTTGSLVHADMTDCHFDVTQLFWDQLKTAGLVAFFKRQTVAGDEPNSTLKVGVVKARIVKISTDPVIENDVCEVIFKNGARTYRTVAGTPAVAGVAMLAAAAGQLCPIAHTGIFDLKCVSGSVTQQGLLVPDTANPGKCKPGANVTSFAHAVAADSAGTVTARLRAGF